MDAVKNTHSFGYLMRQIAGHARHSLESVLLSIICIQPKEQLEGPYFVLLHAECIAHLLGQARFSVTVLLDKCTV